MRCRSESNAHKKKVKQHKKKVKQQEEMHDDAQDEVQDEVQVVLEQKYDELIPWQEKDPLLKQVARQQEIEGDPQLVLLKLLLMRHELQVSQEHEQEHEQEKLALQLRQEQELQEMILWYKQSALLCPAETEAGAGASVAQ